MKPESEKLNHSEVNYEDPSTHSGEQCGNCKHFISGNPPACEGVKKPISPDAWCARFDKIVNIHPIVPQEYSKTSYKLARGR